MTHTRNDSKYLPIKSWLWNNGGEKRPWKTDDYPKPRDNLKLNPWLRKTEMPLGDKKDKRIQFDYYINLETNPKTLAMKDWNAPFWVKRTVNCQLMIIPRDNLISNPWLRKTEMPLVVKKDTEMLLYEWKEQWTANGWSSQEITWY